MLSTWYGRWHDVEICAKNEECLFAEPKCRWKNNFCQSSADAEDNDVTYKIIHRTKALAREASGSEVEIVTEMRKIHKSDPGTADTSRCNDTF